MPCHCTGECRNPPFICKDHPPVVPGQFGYKGPEMSDRYVIRVQYERKGLRHTQFVLINADSREDAELLLSEISSKGKVIGTEAEVDARVGVMLGTMTAKAGPCVDFTGVGKVYKVAET